MMQTIDRCKIFLLMFYAIDVRCDVLLETKSAEDFFVGLCKD